MAADEQASIRQTPEAERSQEQAVKLAQLDAVVSYLDRARQALGEARLALRRDQGSVSHERGDAGLALLKRAREQLDDPLTVLRKIAGDHVQAMKMSEILTAFRAGSIKLDEKKAESAPSWLSGAFLATAEKDVLDRTQEVATRMKAAAEAPAPNDPAQADPEAAKWQALAKQATPLLENAVGELGQVESALRADKIADASPGQGRALESLSRAMELFADLKQLIEITYGQESQVAALLDPESELGKSLPAHERMRLLNDVATANVERVQRITGLLDEEEATALAKIQAAARAQGGGQPGAPAPDPQAADADLENQKAFFAQAKAIRQSAEQALVKQKQEIANRASSAKATAKEALGHLEELRKMFFTLIERLKQLHGDQSSTRDRTASAQAADDSERDSKIPGLSGAQTEHAQTGQGLLDALGQQVASAAQSQDPNAKDFAERGQKAIEELTAAVTEMTQASQALTDAQKAIGMQSSDLTPTVDGQGRAVERLAAAIAALEPPQNDQQDQKDQGQNQDQQNQDSQEQKKDGEQKQPQPSEEEQNSAQQAERKLQNIRDREAERRREREKREQSRPEPVDKDW
jgi:hypothetical protein